VQIVDRLETERLILRLWRKEDAAAFVAINQDAKVIEFLRGPLSLQNCQDFISRANAHFAKHGFGLWAATLKETAEMIGFAGLNVPDFESHFTPCVEIGWRLASQHWGKGYATEVARSALEIGFKNFGLKEIVAFTVPENLRSIAVMERLQMRRDFAGDFAHPKLAPDHSLSQHILYRISK
jgi:RimJ/RimL family protein N-acetyltransferase